MNQPNPFGAGGFNFNGSPRSEPPQSGSPHHGTPRNSLPENGSFRHAEPAPPDTGVPPENNGVECHVISAIPPLRLRIARFVAYAHLILGVLYLASIVYRIVTFIIASELDFIPTLIALTLIFLVYLALSDIIPIWCEVVNDILLGVVSCWPDPLTLPEFFGQLHEEAALNLARETLGQIGLPEVAAAIPHRPHLGPTSRSLLYVTGYFACAFCAPLPALIKAAFWNVEGLFVILFLAYILTNLPVYRRQSRP